MAASLFTKEQVAEFQEAFYLFDRDGDGCITIEELERVIRCLVRHPTKEELQIMIKDADVNKNGKIEFKEFLNIIAIKIREADASKELEHAFDVLDKDRDGYLSPKELNHVMGSLGVKLTEEELEEMIRAADIDGDGRISYDEFVRMMVMV